MVCTPYDMMVCLDFSVNKGWKVMCSKIGCLCTFLFFRFHDFFFLIKIKGPLNSQTYSLVEIGWRVLSLLPSEQVFRMWKNQCLVGDLFFIITTTTQQISNNCYNQSFYRYSLRNKRSETLQSDAPYSVMWSYRTFYYYEYTSVATGCTQAIPQQPAYHCCPVKLILWKVLFASVIHHILEFNFMKILMYNK